MGRVVALVVVLVSLAVVPSAAQDATPTAGRPPAGAPGPLERGVAAALERAAAQTDAGEGDALAAALYPGACDDAADGEPAYELRELEVQAAGESATSVLTSFTTVDAPLAELVGDPVAILVLSGGETALCGEVGGGAAATSRYVGLREVNASGYVGFAWLFAREEQTQVSLFVAPGLGGDRPADGPPPEETEEPEPPTDPTAEPTEAPTAGATGDGETYVSENYGYAVTYDATWRILDEETTEDAAGNPTDVLQLTNGRSVTAFLGRTLGLDPETCVEEWSAASAEDEGTSDYAPKEGPDGEPMAGREGDAAFAVFDYTYTEEGEESELSMYLMCRPITPGREMLMFLHATEQATYETEVEAREELLAGLRLPGEETGA
jgi:hypothetical protein